MRKMLHINISPASAVLAWYLTVGCLVPHSGAAQQKLAQTGMKFLSVGIDARAGAMGDAFTAMEGNVAQLMYNPAGVARTNGFVNVTVSSVAWIADIQHSAIALVLNPSEGRYGVVGLFAQLTDYGTLQGTVRSENAMGYLDIGDFNPRGTALGLSYARALTEKFAIGGNIKFVRQNLGQAATGISADGPLVMDENTANLYAFDFGIIYRTGFKSLTLGMVVRNFSKEAQFKSESFQLPLTFKIGLAMNVAELFDLDRATHAIRVSVDAEHPRDYPEQIRLGLEYGFMNTLYLRGGIVSPADEQTYSFGFGLQKGISALGLGVDYAYTPFGLFGGVHRFSLWISH